MSKKQTKRQRRHKRIRAKVFGTAEVPRLCVFRANKHIYTQLIDDEKGHTMAAASDTGIKKTRTKASPKTGKVASAFEVGKLIAKKAEEKKITKIVFDRGGYKYHGRVKAIAEGARKGGLKF